MYEVIETMVVYHLNGETGPSTVCANQWKAKIPDGTFHSDRPFTIYIKSSNKRPLPFSHFVDE